MTIFGGLHAWMLTAIVSMAGCGSYALSGRVFEGNMSSISVVSKNDERLADHHTYPATGVVIEAVIDPDAMRPIDLGQATVDRDGRFSLPVNVTGAGVLEYQVEITVRGRGYAPIRQSMRLPSGNKRLLITMSQGRDAPLDKPDVIRESIEAGKQFD